MISALVMLWWAAETATDKNECLTSVAMPAFSFPTYLRSTQNLAFIISNCDNKCQKGLSLEKLNLKKASIEYCTFFLFTSDL